MLTELWIWDLNAKWIWSEIEAARVKNPCRKMHEKLHEGMVANAVLQ